jgi:uncharacterized protein (TIGR00725 family)
MNLAVAIVGPGEGATAQDVADAMAVACLVAERGWVTLCGGRNAGVMAAAAMGAKSGGGISVGILPGSDRRDAAGSLSVALPTGLGEARNAVLITAADAVIACGFSSGTLSEIALALKANKPLILVRPSDETTALLAPLTAGASVYVAETAEDAVARLVSGGVSSSLSGAR